MKVGDKMYRYDGYRTWDYEKIEDGHLVPAVEIVGTEFCVEKITPCGCWIVEEMFIGSKRHFVLGHAKKKFAYETKALAMESFITRKQKQIGLLIDNLEFAKKSLSLAIDMKKKKLWKK